MGDAVSMGKKRGPYPFSCSMSGTLNPTNEQCAVPSSSARGDATPKSGHRVGTPLIMACCPSAAGTQRPLRLRQWIATLLFGVQPTDATTLLVVVTTILLVAAVACGLPAWRASRLSPSVALRYE